MVAKEPMVYERRPEFTRIELVAAVRWFWLRNCLHPNMRWRCRDSNWVQLSHGAGVDDGGIWGRLLASLWNILIVRMESGSTEFLWSVELLVSVGVILVKYWGRQPMFIEGGREAWDEIYSSSDGMMWGDWGVDSGVVVDGRTEGVAIALKLVGLGSM